MKIHCRQCGAKFDYELNSGICPRCMEFHSRESVKITPKKPHSRFVPWFFCFLLGSVLAGSPIVYRLAKNSHQEWFQYRQELAKATRRGPDEDFAVGEPIPAGKYYLTPKKAFWMPDVDMVGLTYSDKRFLVIPLVVQKNEEKPLDTELDYMLLAGGEIIDLDFTTHWGGDYWPELNGYFPAHYSFEDYESDLIYLLFSVTGKVNPDNLELRIQESLDKPNSYASTVTHVSRVPVLLSEDGAEEGDLFLRHAHPVLIEAEPGTEFDYYESRLSVSKVQCYKEAGDFFIPEGMKLVRVTIRRASLEWPYTNAEYTALVIPDSTVSANQVGNSLDACFGVDSRDIGSYYYKYNYVSTYLSEEEQEEQRNRENPETISQFYLVDENIEEVEIIFPGMTMGYEDGPVKGYWQIRIPVTLPEAGGVKIYEQ